MLVGFFSKVYNLMIKNKKILIPLSLLLLLLLAAGLWQFELKDNLHTVIPGQIYRSAELGPKTLRQVVDEKGIKTILNLEGSHDAPWYYGEIAISKQKHLAHYNMELNAHHLPRVDQLKRLTQILLTAPRPILIHCHRGSDRTGLASAMSLILAGEPISVAKQQYSLKYYVIAPDSIGKQVIPRYQDWLQQQHRQSTRQNFLDWVAQVKSGPAYPAAEK